MIKKKPRKKASKPKKKNWEKALEALAGPGPLLASDKQVARLHKKYPWASPSDLQWMSDNLQRLSNSARRILGKKLGWDESKYWEYMWVNECMEACVVDQIDLLLERE
jgi:hypothetical protein